MIGSLKGTVSDIAQSCVTLDVGGVGYEVYCSLRTRSHLEIGREASIVTYTDVKEDSIKLFGFEDKLEKQVFLLLLKVKGLGVKSALEIVSAVDKVELLRAIGSGDSNRLTSIRGVGRKTAERVVLELKDRVAEYALGDSVLRDSVPEEPMHDAIAALVALGISRRDAERAVRQIPQSEGASGTGEIVREALRFI